MSEEHEYTEYHFSAFWPLLILLVGFLGWSGVQDYQLNNARMTLNRQVQSAVPAYQNAQGIANRYAALVKDLYQTATKDAAAAQIVRDAVQAGLFQVQRPNGGTTPPPAGSDSSTATGSTTQ